MLEDWSFEPFNLCQERAHPLLLQWYHQQDQHSDLLQQVPLALPQALKGASLGQDYHKSPNSLPWPVGALVIQVHVPAFQGAAVPSALQRHSEMLVAKVAASMLEELALLSQESLSLALLALWPEPWP